LTVEITDLKARWEMPNYFKVQISVVVETSAWMNEETASGMVQCALKNYPLEHGENFHNFTVVESREVVPMWVEKTLAVELDPEDYLLVKAGRDFEIGQPEVISITEEMLKEDGS
jgi:hypothetical protein